MSVFVNTKLHVLAERFQELAKVFLDAGKLREHVDALLDKVLADTYIY
jgi:hypothetical protein